MERILNLFENICGIEKPSSITKFVDMNIDSITFIKLIVNIENEFEIEFEDEALLVEKYETIEDMHNYVLTLSK